MASPRPGASSAAQKSLAYKSPAVKTPASAHGHARNLSVSSQPSSTPLGPAAAHDGLMNLDSPAMALMNSIPPTGLTPLASAQDGLGITTQLRAISTREPESLRSPEADKLFRLQQVVDMLKTRMVGRGITRESVERIVRVHGFEALWDDDILTVAGTIVELEITFDSLSRDTVTDLCLKLNFADGESHPQEAATSVLKAQIGIREPETSTSPPDNLDLFSTNVRYLAHMDRINTNPNAFEAVDGLYKTMHNIWEEEKKRTTWRDELQHLRKSALGRPNIDRSPRLGAEIHYWKSRVSATVPDAESDSEIQEDLWRYHVSCEEGPASIVSTLEWLSPKVLEDKKPGTVFDADDSPQKPSWTESKTAPRTGTDADLDTAMSSESTELLDATFITEFIPEVLIPLNVALRLDGSGRSITIDQNLAIPYTQALQSTRNATQPVQDDRPPESRWLRNLPLTDAKTKTHSYALYSAAHGTELWFYPLSRIAFGHPMQLVDVVPIARQYAVLSNLLRSLVTDPAPAPTAQPSTTESLQNKPHITKRSNVKTKQPVQVTQNPMASAGKCRTTSIDISLDVVSDIVNYTCTLKIFVPLPGNAASKHRGRFVSYTVFVKLNGIIDVPDVSGLPDSDAETLKPKVARMLTMTEDIGLVTEWLIEQATN
jgi:hypothetical protein